MSSTGYQLSYSGGLRGVLPGWIDATDRGAVDVSLMNDSFTAQVETLEITATTASIVMVKDGVTKTFSTSGLGSNALAAAALKALIEADPFASSWVTVAINSATLTATARVTGLGGAVAYTVVGITATEATAADDGAEILFGLGVQHATTDGFGEAPTASVTAAVAQVTHFTPTAVNSLRYGISVKMLTGAYAGQTYEFEYPADGSATVQEIVEGLVAAGNANLPANSVILTEDNLKVIATAEVAGVGFDPGVTTESTATIAIAESVANVVAATAFTRPLAGVATWSPTVVAPQSNVRGEGEAADGYPAGDMMRVRQKGIVYGYVDGTVTRFGAVYVRLTATGAEKVGAFRGDTDSGDAVLLVGARFLEAGTGTAAAPAAVKMQIDLTTNN